MGFLGRHGDTGSRLSRYLDGSPSSSYRRLTKLNKEHFSEV